MVVNHLLVPVNRGCRAVGANERVQPVGQPFGDSRIYRTGQLTEVALVLMRAQGFPCVGQAAEGARFFQLSAVLVQTEVLTVKEVACILKTTRQQVRKMIANGELPALKVGREWRILEADVKSLFKENC